jgi:hypothetical protein
MVKFECRVSACMRFQNAAPFRALRSTDRLVRFRFVVTRLPSRGRGDGWSAFLFTIVFKFYFYFESFALDIISAIRR